MAFRSTKSRPKPEYIQAEPLLFDAAGNDTRAAAADGVPYAIERSVGMASEARRERLMDVIREYFAALDRKAEPPSRTAPPPTVPA